MRPYPMTVLSGGINRLRVKGGASASWLYDLQNAYVTNAGSLSPREGTIRAATLTSTTIGLAAANGALNIFSGTFTTSTATVPAGYTLNVLSNPVNSTATPTIIWYAKPFMGFLYVVAGFSDNSVFHYWLQNGGTWTSSTTYTTGSIVLPPTPNGLAYLAVRDSKVNPTWQGNAITTSGSIVEPNVYTGFMYEALAVVGSLPHTGQVEPVWPVTAGATVQEFGDFNTTSTASDASPFTSASIVPLAPTITNRYGNSSVIAGVVGASPSGVVTTALASTKVTTWAAGTNYAPGAVVQPSKNQGAFVNAIPNGDFEAGDNGTWTGITLTTQSAVNTMTIQTGGIPYYGNYELVFRVQNTQLQTYMTTGSTVTPGQYVIATAYLDPNNSGANLSMFISLYWYTSTGTQLGFVNSAIQQNVGYRPTNVSGHAPAGAGICKVALAAGNGSGTEYDGYADSVTWNLEQPAALTNFLYEAIQPAAGTSAPTEPTWPTVAGTTVADNTITWEAIGTSIITWQAIPILRSGATAPTFPTVIGNSVPDPSVYADSNGNNIITSMSWQAIDRHILDTHCPNTIPVAAGASHIFAGDNDICDYSAAVNPTDWTSPNNAGYLPTGLNNYGDNRIAVLTLYRSNLVALNAGGYQMWQIDPDPANMALLDAQPVGSVWPRAAQSVANNLLFLTEVGVRDLGTIGATANMQIGNLGQPVDPLIVAQFPSLNGSIPGDPNFSKVSLLVSQTISDSSLNNASITAVGATVSTATPPPKYGSYISLNGSTGKLVIPATNPPQLASHDWTFECWIYPTGAASGQGSVLGNANGSIYSNIGIFWNAASQELTGVINGTGIGAPINSVPLNKWTYIAVSVYSGNLYVFINGVLQTGYPQACTMALYDTLVLGNDANGADPFQGGIAGARITTNISRYPGLATTPPVSPGIFPSFTYYVTTQTLTSTSQYPLSLYYPGRGQYWLIFGPQAFVLTINENGKKTWSRYVFPQNITDWTLNQGVLYLRTAGNLVWQLDPNTWADDASTLTTGTNTAFNSVVQWPYSDLGSLGINKELIGVDIVGNGSCNIQVAYNQSDPTSYDDNASFTVSTSVTPPYFVLVDDTVPGEPLPIPINAPSYSLILTFPSISSGSANQWSWYAANLYVMDARGGGATG